MSGERLEGMARVNELIREVRIAMLTTVGEDGRLHSRPMATQQGEPREGHFDSELWFLTRADSGKVFEIRNEAEVNLSYAAEKHFYVSLSGRAQVTRDRAKIAELWKPIHLAWFPKGQDDPELVALRVVVEGAEYWEAPANALVRGYLLLKRAATGGESQVGEHGKVQVRQVG